MHSSTPERDYSQVPEALRELAEHVDHLIDIQYPELRTFPERVRANVMERLRHSDFDDPELVDLLQSGLVPHDPEVRTLITAARQRFRELLTKEVYGPIPQGELVVECNRAAPNPDWPQCCRNFTPDQSRTLAADRAVSDSTIKGLVSRLLLGACFVFKWNSYCIAFPIVDETGTVFRAHCRSPQRNGDGKWDWTYEPSYDQLERPISALIFGHLAHAKIVYIFESQWDAIALIDKLNLFPRVDSGELCIVITRGARGVKRLDDLCFWKWADVYAFGQNDKAGEQWTTDVISSCVGCHVVRTPAPHKDVNDWTRDGATGTELEQVIAHAQFQQPERNRETGGVEFGEFSPLLPVQWGETGEISPNSTGGLCQKAFYPEGSILSDFYQYAITQSEGADAYIVGAILPVVAALLGRNVWVPWSGYEGKLYSNIYSILAGPPGNLKSTSIYPAESIARALLEKNRFLSHNYSPEALFDSFFKQPDRFLVCSDAGSTITKWSNPYDGQRLSHSFLTLFDGEPMSENFRRNREKDEVDSQDRVTGPVSLSILFAATLSKCQFSGNTERDGLQRRFLYNLALSRARKLDRPKPDLSWLEDLSRQFGRLLLLKGAFDWEKAAQKRFDEYKCQADERQEACDPWDESTRGRLATLASYAVKLSMIFEAASLCHDHRWSYGQTAPLNPPLIFHADTLELAISHVEECFNAAQSLADVANQKVIREQAETLLDNIRGGDFKPSKDDPGSIIVTRTQLTRQYAHNAKRRGLQVDDLYARIIPMLIRSGEAKLIQKIGKKEIFAFRIE